MNQCEMCGDSTDRRENRWTVLFERDIDEPEHQYIICSACGKYVRTIIEKEIPQSHQAQYQKPEGPPNIVVSSPESDIRRWWKALRASLSDDLG